MTKQAPGNMTVFAAGAAGRRRFSEEDRHRIVEESKQAGCSVSQTARRYGIAVRVLFRWKEALKPKPTFVPVQVSDVGSSTEAPVVASGAEIVERTPLAMEIELVGGRRVRFERDADRRRSGGWSPCLREARHDLASVGVKIHVALGVIDWACCRGCRPTRNLPPGIDPIGRACASLWDGRM